jgi:urea carboxylase
MEGPGGYQFVGRTCQMWNRWRQTEAFTDGKPWLLRFFDQLRFFPIGERELLAFREDFLHGRAQLDIRPTMFRFTEYRRFLDEHRGSIETFKRRQQSAFEAERDRWARLPPPPEPDATTAGDSSDNTDSSMILEPDEVPVRADITSSVWQIGVTPGAQVRRGDRLLVLESMKMEIPIVAPIDGVVTRVLVRPGALVSAGQLVAALSPRPVRP